MAQDAGQAGANGTAAIRARYARGLPPLPSNVYIVTDNEQIARDVHSLLDKCDALAAQVAALTAEREQLRAALTFARCVAEAHAALVEARSADRLAVLDPTLPGEEKVARLHAFWRADWHREEMLKQLVQRGLPALDATTPAPADAGQEG